MNRVTPRGLGLVGLVGCTAIAVLALLHSREGARAPARRSSASESDVARSADPLPGDRAHPTEPGGSGVAPRGSGTEALPGPLIDGTVTVIDEEGREHPREDGSFRLTLWTDGSGESEEITVSGGAWRAHLARRGKLEASDIRLGGRLAYPEEGDAPVPPDGAVPIRVRWVRPSILRVVEDATGRNLADAEVVRNVDWGRERNVNPAGAGVVPVLPGAMSPVTLPERADTAVYWVRAPGFAWGRIAIDHRAGGERMIRLKRGGTLEVTLVNHRASSGARLSLRPVAGPNGAVPADDEPPLLECPIPADGGMTVEGLDVGRYEARVALRAWFDNPVVLGSAETSVTMGAVATVTIQLADPPATPPAVPVRGTLEIPKGWGDWSPYLSIEATRLYRVAESGVDEPADIAGSRVAFFTPRMTRDESGILHWDAGEIPPDDYVATVSDIAYQVRFRVGMSGESSVRIEIPEPAQCRVRAVERRTGETAPIRRLSWSPARAEGLAGGSLETVEASPEPGVFSFRAPVGKIELEPEDDEWTAESQDWKVREGPNEITLYVARQCGVRVALRDGSASVPMDDGFQVDVTSLDGDGETVGSGSDGRSRCVYLSGPGRYEMKFHAPTGFDPIPPQVVTVGTGEMVDVGVELKRRP